MKTIEIIDYKAVCAVNKQENNPLPDVSNLPKHEADDVINSLMLKRTIRAYNTDQETGKVWQPNWNDINEIKYSIWVRVDADDKRPGGFGFSVTDYGFWCTNTGVGSRLCLKNREDVFHLYKHHKDLLLKCQLIIEE